MNLPWPWSWSQSACRRTSNNRTTSFITSYRDAITILREEAALLQSGTHQRYLKRYAQYLALGQLLHSVVVGSLAVYLLFSDAEHISHYSNSWLEFVTVEISLAFFVADLFTTLIFFPDAIVQDKGDLIHHIFGVSRSTDKCVPTECNCNVLTAFTTLCTVLTATTLFTGVWEERHTSVSAGVYCTDLAAFHVTDCNFSMALEALCLLCSDRGCNI